MQKQIEVTRYETTEGEFYFALIGSETHGKPSIKLWISKRLVSADKDGNYILVFPVQKARIEKTAKGSLVMRVNDNWMVHYIFVPCGYRGGSSINILQPPMAEVFEFQEYRSPLGSIGKSVGALVNVPVGVILKYGWFKWGRLYGKPDQGITEVLPDGEEHTLTRVTVDDLEEIKSLT